MKIQTENPQREKAEEVEVSLKESSFANPFTSFGAFKPLFKSSGSIKSEEFAQLSSPQKDWLKECLQEVGQGSLKEGARILAVAEKAYSFGVTESESHDLVEEAFVFRGEALSPKVLHKVHEYLSERASHSVAPKDAVQMPFSERMEHIENYLKHTPAGGEKSLFLKEKESKQVDYGEYTPHADGKTGEINLSAYEMALRLDVDLQVRAAGLEEKFPASIVLAYRSQFNENNEKTYQAIIQNIPGDTLDVALTNDSLSETDMAEIRGQLYQQQNFLLEAGLLQDDVKPQNVIVSKDSSSGSVHAQFIDLGLPDSFGEFAPIAKDAPKEEKRAYGLNLIDQMFDKL